jgi:hypothetical protein
MVPVMRWWKVAGLAGLAGVAASGVVVARAQRQRNAYTPDEVRDRLRARAAEAGVERPDSTAGPADSAAASAARE